MHGEDDQVVQESRRLGISPADELIHRFDQLMRAEHFSGVQAAVEPDDALAFLRERVGLFVGKPLGERQPAGNVLVAIELLVVFGRRNDGHQLRPAFGRLADLDHLHSLGFLVELLPVVDKLRVGGELIVVADIEAEMLFRRGDGLRRRRGRSDQQKKHSRK